MSLAKANPGQLDPRPQRKRYAWEGEETLVDKRRRLDRRILRFFSENKWWLLLIGLILLILFDAGAMTMFLSLFAYIFRLMFVVAFILIQFVAMFFIMGRSRMYTIWPGQEGISFDDYRGQPEIVSQAKQIVKLLRGVKVFEEAGGEPLNGLLLEGPPGTGKTYLAQAISKEAGVPFFFVDASSLNGMFMGMGALRVARVYNRARKAAKEYGASVIFLDEIDVVGSRAGVATAGDMAPDALRRNRLPIMMGMGMGSGLLSVLLIEMSGFSLEHGWRARWRTRIYKYILRRKPPKPNKRVLTIGATNRIGALDPALLRPGRFDKKIRIDAPDLEGRRDIIEYYLTKIAHDDSIDPVVLASETPFYTPADIRYLLNEALRYALFEGRTYMTIRDVRMAQPEHEYGLRTPIKNLSKEDERRLAAHEGGHAMAVRIFRPNYRIARVTIIRQGWAHGYVLSYPANEDDYYGMDTYESLMNQLRVSVAGKAGEMEFCGVGAQTLGVGTGFGDASDFGRIRAVLYNMASAGMFGALGAMVSDNPASVVPPKEVADQMDEAFREALAEVRMAFRLHYDMGVALIDLLQEKKELLANEVEAFFDQYGFYTPKVNIESDHEPLVVVKPDEAAEKAAS